MAVRLRCNIDSQRSASAICVRKYPTSHYLDGSPAASILSTVLLFPPMARPKRPSAIAQQTSIKIPRTRTLHDVHLEGANCSRADVLLRTFIRHRGNSTKPMRKPWASPRCGDPASRTYEALLSIQKSLLLRNYTHHNILKEQHQQYSQI